LNQSSTNHHCVDVQSAKDLEALILLYSVSL